MLVALPIRFFIPISTPVANLSLHADDDSNSLLHPPSTPAKTTWTLLLYLTSPLSGGETIFYPPPSPANPSPITVAPLTGMALLHRHGQECLLHEGREVLQGEKWIVRSDLCVRR